ncbi:MAG: hypothetical protein ACRENO_07185 [Thermodesulfobacteriota bacterium]
MKIKFALLIVFSLVLASGCGSKKAFNKQNITPLKSADTFYKMLLWKYYDRAGAFVHQDKLAAYDTFASENEDNLNITSYEVRDFTPIDDNNAKVKVVITYYRYPSVVEKTITLWNEWEKINDAWFVNYEFVTTDFTKEE